MQGFLDGLGDALDKLGAEDVFNLALAALIMWGLIRLGPHAIRGFVEIRVSRHRHKEEMKRLEHMALTSHTSREDEENARRDAVAGRGGGDASTDAAETGSGGDPCHRS